jgi:16S rRNA (uracil1498-N3)-methyltransferase
VPHRFYAPDLAADLSVVSLPADEAAHLVRVLRLKAGESVVVFDGRGGEFLARVESVARGNVRVRPIQQQRAVREPAVALTLGQAILKSDKMDRVVRDAVMLGVTAVQPLVSARAEVSRAARHAGGRTARWQRIAVASVKQCGRAVVPLVRETVDLAGLLASDASEVRLVLVEPAGDASRSAPGIALVRARPRPAAATVLIGPEGGWTPDEIEAAGQAGFLPVTLGVRTLRADAAGVAAMAILQFVWGDL